LCVFLGVQPQEDYLEACAGIIYDKPHKSRTKIHWDDALVEEVREKSQPFGFLQDYSLSS
jgi:hypothetical protein